jgi:putative endonuclease
MNLLTRIKENKVQMAVQGHRNSRDSRRVQGLRAEDRATKFLAKHGYRIIERNVSYKIGELDIVAEDGDALVFIEVRSRTHSEQVHPAATITPYKQRQIIRAAMAYCQNHHITDRILRFDVVAVLDPLEGIELYKNAFETKT